MKTIAGLFPNYSAADRAVCALEQAGFDESRISVLARDSAIEPRDQQDKTAGEVAGGAGVGALGGGLVGGLAGLLVGMGAIFIPGLGPAFAAGTFAAVASTAMAGAGVGAATGGILGAMVTLHIPFEDAQVYAEGVKRGAILVTVEVDESESAQASQVIRDAKPLDLRALRTEWEQAGWRKFDENDASRS